MSGPRGGADSGFGWLQIVRLGLVQSALGAIVVLATSTLNRVMVVELALPALLPGLLVGLHYVVQISRPRFGHGSDVAGRRTPAIVGGMTLLALGGLGAALAVSATAPHGAGSALMLAAAVLAFVAIGLGVGAAGTSLLAMLAERVAPSRRAPAATVVWLMMIAGFALTATLAGRALDPYTPARLVAVTGGVCALAWAVALAALYRVEGRSRPMAAALAAPASRPATISFRKALAEVWADAPARRFTAFVFLSMLAYSAQDLILEPFAGAAFGYTPGRSTALSGTQHGGVLVGMLIACALGRRAGAMRTLAVGGCIASAAALAALAGAAAAAPRWPLDATVFALGAANGVFSVAALGAMMSLAGGGRRRGEGGSREDRSGLRMGLWGAAQALAFAVGGVAGTGAVDLARQFLTQGALAYGLVFAGEAVLFLWAGMWASRVVPAGPARRRGEAAGVAEAGDVPRAAWLAPDAETPLRAAGERA